MQPHRLAKPYIIVVLATGVACALYALINLPLDRLDIKFALLVAFTIGLGSRVTIQIPRFKSHIAVSDTFIFLALLLYGGEIAVILAALEALASSLRFCNRKITVFFNAATMAVSTTAVVLALQALNVFTGNGLNIPDISGTDFAIALCVIALTQFTVNTSLASIYDSLKTSLPLWETWKSKYVWAFFTYFVGVSGAAALVQLSTLIGPGIIFATFPVIYFLYLSYRMYLKNVEISMQQAEQAEQYAKILETKSDALRESEERFRSAFDYAPIGIAIVAPNGAWLKVNQALTNILGYTEDELLSMDFQSITSRDDLPIIAAKVNEVLAGQASNCQLEQRYIHKTGRTVWTAWSVSAVSDTRSKQPNLIFQIQDITDKKVVEEKLQRDATHDELTGLPNRSLFVTRLTRALNRIRESKDYEVSILFIDLDRFKYVNDSLGHMIGDQLLKDIAARLSECMRPSDTVARLGGDEFTILVEGKYDRSEVTRIAERIQDKFSKPFNLAGHDVYSSASIGIVHASDKHRSPEDIMRDADTAMYQAKRTGKARHAVFDDEMHSVATEILMLETDLRKALDREEIGVHYQPIYSLVTGRIECLEALARWQHAELGMIPPSKFIPLAEEIGLIDRLSEQVLRTSCGEIESLNRDRAENERFAVSVNLSCRQFGQASLVPTIGGILRDAGFTPRDLKLEITESVFFEHQDRAIEMLNQLRETGIEIDIDDFGTGYSNLGYLKKLPVSAIKIDRSFVSMIDGDDQNAEVVAAIITLAHNLGLRVIAEGVETALQLDTLRDLECESAQGYLFAEPMSLGDLVSFIGSPEVRGGPPAGFNDVATISSIQ